MLWPLALMLRQGLMVDGLPSVAPLQEALHSRSVARALSNSLDSAAVSATLSLILGRDWRSFWG